MTEAEIQERLKKLDPDKRAKLAKLLGVDGGAPDADLLATVTTLQKGHARILKHLGLTDGDDDPPVPAPKKKPPKPAADDDTEGLVDGILKYLGVA